MAKVPTIHEALKDAFNTKSHDKPYDPFGYDTHRRWNPYIQVTFHNAEPGAKYTTVCDSDQQLQVQRNGKTLPKEAYTIDVVDDGWEVSYRVTLYQDFVKDLDKTLPLKGGKTGGSTPSLPSSDMQQALMDVFLAGAGVLIEKGIAERTDEAVKKVESHLDALKTEIEKHKVIEIKRDGTTKQIKGLTHKQFTPMLSSLTLGFPLLLVGSAGSGKTYAAEQAAEALDLPFYAISVGLQTSKSDLFGYMSASGAYISTAYRKAYEGGGVFLLDEADAGNANVLVMLNSALSGNMCAFPDQMVKRHPDFYLIATANTYGTGASRMYVGRNQLDAATLDRFIVIDWEVDEDLEASLVASYQKGKNWHRVVKDVRQQVAKSEMRVIVSPRATVKGARLLESGLAFEQVVDSVLLPTATMEQRKTLMESAKHSWKG